MSHSEHARGHEDGPAAGKSFCKLRPLKQAIAKLVGRGPPHIIEPPRQTLQQPEDDNASQVSAHASASTHGAEPTKLMPMCGSDGITRWYNFPLEGVARCSTQVHRQEGNRHVHNNWSFTMSGGTSHEVPHSAFVAMDGEQRHRFDGAGGLPFSFGVGAGDGHGHGGAAGGGQLMLQASSGHAGSQGKCQSCGRAGLTKRFATPVGNSWVLCNGCVWDQACGDQGEFERRWGEGK